MYQFDFQIEYRQTYSFFILKPETFETLFNFKEENKHDTDFSMPSSEELKELTELMAECGLEDSALYKSYTVDTSSVVEDPPVEVPIPDAFIVKMFQDPLPIDCQDYANLVIEEINNRYEELSQDLKDFFEKHIGAAERKRIGIFQLTLDQAACITGNWFKFRRFRATASKIRQINYARNPKTRYAAFLGYEPCFNLYLVFPLNESTQISKICYKIRSK